MKKLIFIIMLLPFFNLRAYAGELESEAADMADIYSVEDSLPEESRDINGQFKLDGSYDGAGALKRLWQKTKEKAAETFRAQLRFAGTVMSVALFCALCTSVCSDSGYSVYIEIAGSCTVAMIIAGGMEGLVSQSLSALRALSDYSRAAMPAIFTSAALCGAVSSSAVRYGSVCMAMELFMTAAQNIIIPLICAYTAISLSRAIFDNPLICSAAKLCKSISVFMMSCMAIGLSTYISLSGLIAGSTDAMAVKTVKTVISGSLPVVGGIISDAASAVLASASIIKNSAGVFSLIAICSLCGIPFAQLWVKMLVYKLIAAAADMLPGGRISTVLNGVGTTLAMLMGLVGSFGIMLFLSIIAGIRVIVP